MEGGAVDEITVELQFCIRRVANRWKRREEGDDDVAFNDWGVGEKENKREIWPFTLGF